MDEFDSFEQNFVSWRYKPVGLKCSYSSGDFFLRFFNVASNLQMDSIGPGTSETRSAPSMVADSHILNA